MKKYSLFLIALVNILMYENLLGKQVLNSDSESLISEIHDFSFTECVSPIFDANILSCLLKLKNKQIETDNTNHDWKCDLKNKEYSQRSLQFFHHGFYKEDDLMIKTM